MLKHALFLFSFISISLLSNAQTAVQLPLLCNWNDTSIKANLSYSQKYNDVWGFEWKGVQYAAIGSTEGVHIIDIQQLTGGRRTRTVSVERAIRERECDK